MTERILKMDIEILPWQNPLIGSSLKSRGPPAFYLYFSDTRIYFKHQCRRGVGVVRVDLETSHCSLYNHGPKQNPEKKNRLTKLCTAAENSPGPCKKSLDDGPLPRRLPRASTAKRLYSNLGKENPKLKQVLSYSLLSSAL